MPDATWYFCRTCSYRGQFVVGPDAEVECPECRKRYVTTIMRRQDVEWAKVAEQSPKDAA
jgi:hypothetical protein